MEDGARLNLDLLDDDDPFEVDEDNRPHLFKHGRYGDEDLSDIWFSDPDFFPAHPPAHWLMVGQPPGEPHLVVPLAPPRSGDVRKARPIGIYQASGQVLDYYRSSRSD